MTAHVVPRAKPYPDHRSDRDEDEKTTIESHWEDEASTTVEQGEVADKVRNLGLERHPSKHNTGLTHTGTGIEEPTVDDQHAPVLSAITPIRPEINARLFITQGNDNGQELEIRPGKTYTIGRGIDTDFVLTDIAVSRKHFDLKHEDGAWIIVDRGSGNGTIVNGNLEDNPFMLASGDVIEIGNTVFRFEQPNGAPRMSQRTYDIDDEELSTVAGKPVRTEISDDPPPPPQPRAVPMRPKTLPPPTPMRHGSPSTPPPLSFAQNPPQQALQPASTLPMPQMANRPPLQPAMLGDSMGMPNMNNGMNGMPNMHDSMNGMANMHGHNGMNGMASLPVTIQGQGPMPRPSYPYPQATEIPPHSVHAALLVQSQNRRGDGSTAHVSPSPYDPMNPMMGMAQPYRAPSQLSKRTKLLLAGIALAVLTGIVTAAVVKSSSKKPAATASTTTKDSAKTTKPEPKKGPTVEPIVTPKIEPPKQEVAAARVEPPKQEAPKVEPPKQEVESPKQEVAAARVEPPKQEAPKVEPPKQVKQEPKKQTKVEPKKRVRETPRETPREEPRVAAAFDASDALDKAESLYRSKKFGDAASVLNAAAKKAGGEEAKELRLKAGLYSNFAKAYALGTAPAQKANVAFEQLRSAVNVDDSLGGAFKEDLATRLTTVAPKAAVTYLGLKEYAKARTALLVAQKYGSTDGNLGLVKSKLESIAGELYNEAAKEISTNPGPAKEKLRQVKAMVDPKSPVAAKAQALLNKN